MILRCRWSRQNLASYDTLTSHSKILFDRPRTATNCDSPNTVKTLHCIGVCFNNHFEILTADLHFTQPKLALATQRSENTQPIFRWINVRFIDPKA